ncbi:MAG TPA: hypothetical protein VG126_13315, partial [Thermoleophilaceae bacterium]|nr:hypothetical protein [Thermoleophilaceae bacterium]
MTPPDPDNTATIERDLAAVDDALRTDAADHDDPFVRELQELGLVLRAEAAEPDAEFAEALGERMRQGFPPAPGSVRALRREARSELAAARAWPARAVRRLPSPRRMLPAAGALLTVAVFVVAVSSVDFNRSDDEGGEGGGGGSVAQTGGGGGVGSSGGGAGFGGGARPAPADEQAAPSSEA